jgi:hypothetical protein
MHGGGYWDKKGNQFEDRWALRQLVLLMSPSSDIESLEREPAGDDEPGVDLWVNRKDGTRDCYQCRSGNQGKATWSMADLTRGKILEHLKLQVSREPKRHRYCLVSGIPAPLFKRLCEEARDSRDASTFFDYQVHPRERLQTAILAFCEALGLSLVNPGDRQLTWSLLRRSSVILTRSDEEELREMADRFESRVDHDPMAALRALESWLREQLGCPIDVEGATAYLAEIGFKSARESHPGGRQPPLRTLAYLLAHASFARASWPQGRTCPCLLGSASSASLPKRWGSPCSRNRSSRRGRNGTLSSASCPANSKSTPLFPDPATPWTTTGHREESLREPRTEVVTFDVFHDIEVSTVHQGRLDNYSLDPVIDDSRGQPATFVKPLDKNGVAICPIGEENLHCDGFSLGLPGDPGPHPAKPQRNLQHRSA